MQRPSENRLASGVNQIMVCALLLHAQSSYYSYSHGDGAPQLPLTLANVMSHRTKNHSGDKWLTDRAERGN